MQTYDIEALCAGVETSDWDVGNQVLYDLCRRFPRHDNKQAIIAKVWLIGRAYAAAIERRKNKTKIGDDFYTNEVAQCFSSSIIDQLIDGLADFQGVSDENLPDILRVHKSLMNEVCKITGHENRSLCSKYLHFHKPDLFFIYDTRAVNALRMLSKTIHFSSQVAKIGTENNPDCDPEYGRFCHQALKVKNYIQESVGKSLSVRHLDNLLLKVENGNAASKK